MQRGYPYAQEDGNNIRQVKRHSSERKDRIGSNGTGEIKQARKDSEDCGEPDGTDRCSSEPADVTKVSTIRKTVISAEGIHGAGTRL